MEVSVAFPKDLVSGYAQQRLWQRSSTGRSRSSRSLTSPALRHIVSVGDATGVFEELGMERLAVLTQGWRRRR